MALHALVATHATLQHLGDILRRDARAVVVHRQDQPGAADAWRGERLGGEQYAPVGPLEGIFQQVAQQFLQVARFAMEARGLINVELAQHALGRVHLFQPAHDFLGVGLDRQRCREQLVPGGCRTRQLVTHQVVHAPQLHVEFLAQILVLRATVELGAQYGERCFQAVRKVGQRVALALEVFALAFDERVDAVGERFQLTRMAFAHALGFAALDLGQLGDHAPHRAQAPLQDHRLQQQQDQAGTAHPEPHPATEHAQLRTERARVFHHVDGVREFGGGVRIGVPHQAQTIAVHRALAAVDLDHRQRAFEYFLARCEQPAAHGGQHRAFGGHGVALAAGHHHLQVQAAAGHIETRVRRLLADVQRAVAGEVDAGRIGGGVVLQALAQVGACGVGECRVQCVACNRQEGEQAHTGGQQLACLQGARPPAFKEPQTA